MSNDSRHKIALSVLKRVDFDRLTPQQHQHFSSHLAERLSLTTLCCQRLVNEFERTCTPQQHAVLRAFVNDLNQLDKLSGEIIDLVASLGIRPKEH